MRDITIFPLGEVSRSVRRSAWTTYVAAMEPLRALAIQRHLMTRAEFDEVMDDLRVTKYLATDADGSVVGVGTMTNQIESMPLVEPQFFASRWPEHWASGRCYYIGFVAVHPDQQHTELFTEMIQLMSYTASLTGGVAVLDVCQHHVDQHELPLSVGRITQSVVPHVQIQQVDAQSYWAYVSPVPAAGSALITTRDGALLSA